MSFPRYPAYKSSGVEWLGEVPEHWSIIRLKNVLQCRITDGPHTTPEFIDEGVPFLSVDGIQDGELRFDGCRFISEKDHEEFSRKAQPVRDDILMGKAASTGKIARVKTDFTFSIWSPLALIRVNSQLSSPSFYEQALKSASSQAQIDVLCTSNTQKNISMDDIPRLVMTRPTIEEQLAIATFLDHETAKIDALIAEQQRLIELLQEKRQAVISHAVTKGLNPHAPMKDSGVEWLGEVPEHWEVKRLKHITRQISVGIVVEPSKYYDDEGDVPALRSLNVRQGRIDAEDCVYISSESNELLGKSVLRSGDLVIVRTGQPGTCAVIPPSLDGCNCIDLIFARAPARGSSDYLMYQLSSSAAKHQYDLGSDGAIQQHFNVTTATNLIIAWPPDGEQHAICSYLNMILKRLDNLIEATYAAVRLLQERRSALISAAVTGQIDVRGLVPEAEAA